MSEDLPDRSSSSSCLGRFTTLSGSSPPSSTLMDDDGRLAGGKTSPSPSSEVASVVGGPAKCWKALARAEVGFEPFFDDFPFVLLLCLV